MPTSPIIAALVTGTLLGFLGAQVLFLEWWTLIPWGIAGVIIGCRSTVRREAISSGLVYGFVLVMVFMTAQYSGEVAVIRQLPSFGLLALFGAACGFLLTFTGFLARRRRKL